MPQYQVIYEVEEIRGSCPVYKEGDKIAIDTKYPTEVINLEKSTAVCVRAIDNMWSRVTWQMASDDVINHLRGVDGECRIACSMPGEPYTPCGYVIFRIKREKIE